MGFVDASGAIIEGSHATFHLPKRWVTASPMSYRREHTLVINATVNGALVGDVMLVYGYSKMLWDSCDYDGMATDALYNVDTGVQKLLRGRIPEETPSEYVGQICLMTSGSPWWTNFVAGDVWGETGSSERDQGYCTSGTDAGGGDKSWDETRCSIDRRFAMFVREVDCSGASAGYCASLNRESCYSTAGTCGACLYGYDGVAGDSNVPCICSCTNGGTCARESDFSSAGVRNRCLCPVGFAGLRCELTALSGAANSSNATGR